MGFERVIIAVIISCNLIFIVSAVPGIATFYTPPYIPSACYGFQDQGTMIAAASPDLYANGAGCGKMYRVRCIGGTSLVPICRGNGVTVKIVDLCPECQPGQLKLSQEAFAIIANPDVGRILTDYVQV